jgi:hypothetical protein
MAALNDEQTMLRDMAREWADNESPVGAFRALRNAAPAAAYDAASSSPRSSADRRSAIFRSGWCSNNSAAR